MIDEEKPPFDPNPLFREHGLPLPEEVEEVELVRMLERANAILTLFLTMKGSEHIGGWSEDDRRYLGRLCFPFIENRKSWHEAQMRIAHFWTTLQVRFPDHFTWETWMLVAPLGIRDYCLDMALWFENGFPKVVVNSKLSANLMATALSPDVEDMIIPPWKCFIIELEDSPLPLVTKHNKVVRVDQLFVRVAEEGLELKVFAGVWEIMGLSVLPIPEIVSRDVEEKVENFLDSQKARLKRMIDLFGEDDLAQSGFTAEEVRSFFERNARVTVMAQRLTGGICLLMSDPRNVQQFRPKLKPTITAKERRGIPIVRTFKLMRPVTIDCRSAVAEYVFGTRETVHTVQTLVRGHWKKQAHGTGLTLRKLIHVEPYWRGPEDAPIALRPHVVESAG